MNWLELTGAIAAAAGLAVFYAMMALLKNSPQKKLGKAFRMPDVRRYYSAGALYKTFEEAGESGRPQMRRYWMYDFGLMACLTVLMLLVTMNIAAKGTWIYALMISLSMVRTLVDAGEDLLLLSLLHSYPKRRDDTAWITGIVTACKHALLIVWLALLFFLLLIKAFV
jgi:hypothetical protein